MFYLRQKSNLAHTFMAYLIDINLKINSKYKEVNLHGTVYILCICYI